jgi:hypothetical protein
MESRTGMVPISVVMKVLGSSLALYPSDLHSPRIAVSLPQFSILKRPGIRPRLRRVFDLGSQQGRMPTAKPDKGTRSLDIRRVRRLKMFVSHPSWNERVKWGKVSRYQTSFERKEILGSAIIETKPRLCLCSFRARRAK